MNELKPTLRALVTAWADEATPDASATEHAWRELDAAVRAGRVPPLEGTTGATLGATLVGGLAVVTLIAGVGLAVATSEPSERAPAQRDDVTVVAAPSTTETTIEPSAAPVPVAAVVGDGTTSSVSEPAVPSVAAPRSRRKRSPPSPVSAPAATSEAPSLAAELALLREARAALRSGLARRALELTASHAKRYPSSAFAEERSATEVMALCAMGRTDTAKKKAAVFRERYPRSTFEAGLIEACEDEH